MVKKLGIPSQEIQPFHVYIGNGDTLTCSKICQEVQVCLQGVEFVMDLHILPIKGPDLVLGIQWLQSLGVVTHDYKKVTMQFEWKGTPITLKGETNKEPQPVTFSQLQALVQAADFDHLYEMHQVESMGTEKGIKTKHEGSELFPTDLSIPLHDVLLEFQDLFLDPTSLPPKRKYDHRIHLLPNTKPVNVKPYRYPHFQKNEMERLLKEMMEQGIIRPSHSPFSSPVLLVKKKDGTYRFCVDYRALNAVTIRDNFPIPTIDELFDELGHAAMFTKLDLRAGYHQIWVQERDVFKTAFRTHEGHYEFLVMPFGLTNAPSTFQATMNLLFHNYLRKFVIVFFDDILVYSANMKEHVDHLTQVFQCLAENNFYFKLSKCYFGKDKIEYLGHIVSKQGVMADQSKVDAMVSWPKPSNLKQLRGFLGLTGYYRRFIRQYAMIAAPLTDLLKKDAFKWTMETEKTFEALKKVMTMTPVLKLPDFSMTFVVETDASNIGIGAVLMQSEQPIAYFSKKMGPRMQGKSAYLKELFAITEAVKKWRQYLLGRFFVIRTDQRSLKELFQQVIQTPEQQFYVKKLLGYTFHIEYKVGATNKAADALSRREEGEPGANALLLLSRPTTEVLAILREENKRLQELIELHERVTNGAVTSPFEVKERILYYQNRFFIGKESQLKQLLLQEFHDAPSAMHGGVKRKLVRLSQLFFWPKMHEEVQKYVAKCQVCQQMKYSTQAPAGLLQPLPTPSKV